MTVGFTWINTRNTVPPAVRGAVSLREPLFDPPLPLCGGHDDARRPGIPDASQWMLEQRARRWLEDVALIGGALPVRVRSNRVVM